VNSVVKRIIKHWDHDNIAAGAKFEQKWDSDADYKIKCIFFKRKDGADFTATDVTIRIAGVPLTIDHALVVTFGKSWHDRLPIEEDLLRGQKFEYEGYNRETATVSIVVELILDKV